MLRSGRRWPANKFLMTDNPTVSVSLYFGAGGFQQFAVELSIQTVHAYCKTLLVLNLWSHCWSMCPFMSKSCIFSWRKLLVWLVQGNMQLLQLVGCGLHLPWRDTGFFLRCGDQGYQHIVQHLNGCYSVDTQWENFR